MSTLQTVRRWIMTGAIAGITITGTIYGAGLRSRQEFNQEKQRLLEASPQEMIVQLEAARADLVSRRKEVERRLDNFEMRRHIEDTEQAGKGSK